MTIDEAQKEFVKEFMKSAMSKKCDNCDLCYAQGTNGENIELMLQCADWLEELKVYQQHEIICNKGYNKAIDDFVAFTKEHEYKYGNADITSIVIGFNEFIAEQLKVGETK